MLSLIISTSYIKNRFYKILSRWVCRTKVSINHLYALSNRGGGWRLFAYKMYILHHHAVAPWFLEVTAWPQRSLTSSCHRTSPGIQEPHPGRLLLLLLLPPGRPARHHTLLLWLVEGSVGQEHIHLQPVEGIHLWPAVGMHLRNQVQHLVDIPWQLPDCRSLVWGV